MPGLLDRGHVGHERASEPGGERRREVARLIGVRQEHQRGRFLVDERRERRDVAVGRVLGERRRVDDDDLRDVGGGELRRGRVDARPEHRDPDRSAGLLRRGDRLPRGAIQLPVALLGDDEDHD